MRKALLVAGAALALAAGPAMAQQKSIKIGFVSTFSGPTAVIGNDMRNSFELALDHMGRKMGGLPVEVIYEDDGQKPEVGKQKTAEADRIRPRRLHRRLHLVERAAGLGQAGRRLQDLHHQRQWRPARTRRRIVLALFLLDLVAERPDARRDGSLHEPEGREVALSDRPELRRRQGHAGGRGLHLQGQDRRAGTHHLAVAARLLRRTGEGQGGQSGRHLRVLSGQGRRAVSQSIRPGRPEG